MFLLHNSPICVEYEEAALHSEQQFPSLKRKKKQLEVLVLVQGF